MNGANNDSFASPDVEKAPSLRADDPPHQGNSLSDSPVEQQSSSLPHKDETPLTNSQPVTDVVPRWRLLLARLRSNYRRHKILYSRVLYGFITGILVMIWAIGVWKSALNNMKKVENNFSIQLADPSRFEMQLLVYGRLRAYNPVEKTISVLFSPQMLDKDGNFIALPAGELAIYTDDHAETTPLDPTKAAGNWTGPRFGPADEWLPEWLATIDVGQVVDGLWAQPDNGYPFDTATGAYSFSATLNGQNLPVAGIVMVESILNYYVWVGTFDRQGCTDATGSCYMPVALFVQRPAYVRFSAMVVLVVNWIVTIALCMLTGEIVVAKRVHVLKETDELAVFFAALFALPTIRQVLPGAPPYGCLFDMIGILPNIVLVSCCAFILTFWRISRRKNTKELM